MNLVAGDASSKKKNKSLSHEEQLELSYKNIYEIAKIPKSILEE